MLSLRSTVALLFAVSMVAAERVARLAYIDGIVSFLSSSSSAPITTLCPRRWTQARSLGRRKTVWTSRVWRLPTGSKEKCTRFPSTQRNGTHTHTLPSISHYSPHPLPRLLAPPCELSAVADAALLTLSCSHNNPARPSHSGANEGCAFPFGFSPKAAREIVGAGMHKTVVTRVVLERLAGHGASAAATRCAVTLAEEVEETAFVDLYQVEEDARFGGPTPLLPAGHMDLEIPSSRAEPALALFTRNVTVHADASVATAYASPARALSTRPFPGPSNTLSICGTSRRKAATTSSRPSICPLPSSSSTAEGASE